VGGKDLPSVVRRILKRLIADELATQITLTGKTGKIALQRTNVHNSINGEY
jgi:hypothetical protein